MSGTLTGRDAQLLRLAVGMLAGMLAATCVGLTAPAAGQANQPGQSGGPVQAGPVPDKSAESDPPGAAAGEAPSADAAPPAGAAEPDVDDEAGYGMAADEGGEDDEAGYGMAPAAAADDEAGYGMAAEGGDEDDEAGYGEPESGPARRAPTYDDPDDAVGFAAEPGAASGYDNADDAAGFGGGSGDGADFGVDAYALGSDAPAPPPPSNAGHWSATAFLRSGAGFWVERFKTNPIAKLRQSGDLAIRYKKEGFRLHVAGHLEYDFAYAVQREDYDQPTLDEYETQALIRETFLGYGTGPVELTFGWQISAWGEGDVVSPVDVVNPRDLREPGLADLDDLRMPVLSTTLGFFIGDHRLEGMVIHEAYMGLRSPPFGPFSPAAKIFAGSGIEVGGIDLTPILQEADIGYRHATERWDWKNQQFLGRWVYKGPGIDAGVYAGSVLDKQGVIRGLAARLGTELAIPFPVDLNQATLAGPIEADMVLEHRRYTMVGTSGAVPAGDFVLKWEGAASIDLAVNVGDPDNPTNLDVDEARLVGGMLGASYNGITDTTIFVEVAKNWLVNKLSMPTLFPVDMPTLALRTQSNFLKERLVLSVAGTLWGFKAQYGGLVRAELSYTIMDGLKLGGGFITFQPTERVGPIYGFDTHDRVFIKLRYDFTII